MATAIEESIVVPKEAGTLDGFRRWATSSDFPEAGQITYVAGDILIDMTPEKLEPHNALKRALTTKLDVLNARHDWGKVFADRMLLTNPAADLSCEPDLMFARWETLESGRLELVSDAVGHATKELLGTPDLVVEIVSDSSERKDKQLLRERYHLAGVPEYWLVDARGKAIDFQLLRHEPQGYVATEPTDGWRCSTLLAHRLRITRRRDRIGGWEYSLDAEPIR